MIPIPKKGDLKKYQYYRTLSLICYSSKILLNIISKRLNPLREQILSEQQAGFRKGISTVEQLFNCRNIIDKHLNSQNNIFHNFIDFKKAFDRVGIMITYIMMDYGQHKFGIQNEIIVMIKALGVALALVLYDNSTNAVLVNNTQGKLFKTTVGVRQYCLL